MSYEEMVLNLELEVTHSSCHHLTKMIPGRLR